MIEILKRKNTKWWAGIIACVVLFVFISSFTFIKMKTLVRGVQLVAVLDKNNDSSLVNIKGNAKNAIYLTLNGREIFIDKDGTFNESMALPPGVSVVTISALDKFGKTVEKKFEVFYKDNKEVAVIN